MSQFPAGMSLVPALSLTNAFPSYKLEAASCQEKLYALQPEIRATLYLLQFTSINLQFSYLKSIIWELENHCRISSYF